MDRLLFSICARSSGVARRPPGSFTALQQRLDLTTTAAPVQNCGKLEACRPACCLTFAPGAASEARQRYLSAQQSASEREATGPSGRHAHARPLWRALKVHALTGIGQPDQANLCAMTRPAGLASGPTSHWPAGSCGAFSTRATFPW